jgi:hypothetical protein
LKGSVTWITASKNVIFLDGVVENLRCFSWENRERALDRHYDLSINLEDSLDVALFLEKVQSTELFGAYCNSSRQLRYTNNSKCWFDLSIISSYREAESRQLKIPKPADLSGNDL